MSNKSTRKHCSVVIIVLNYKGIEDTKDAIASLIAQHYDGVRIIAVENGSEDNSVHEFKKLEQQYGRSLVTIYNDKNLGFAGGANTGIRWAIENDFEYIALFNNDAVGDVNWLQNLLNASRAKDIGITTGLLLNSKGNKIDSTGEQYSIWGLPFPRNRGDSTVSAPKNELVFGATGGATLYKTALFQDIGLFDEDFFAYYEDVDISFRAQLAGWKVAYTPQAVAYHKQGATSQKIPGFTVYQTFKNLPLLFEKNIPKGLLFSVGIRFYFAYTMMFLNAIKHGAGVPASKGLLKSMVLKFPALAKRRAIQRNKRVSTDYIKSILWPDLPPDQTGLRKLRRFFTGK